MLRRREIGALVVDAISHSASGHHTCPALSLGDPRAGCDASHNKGKQNVIRLQKKKRESDTR